MIISFKELLAESDINLRPEKVKQKRKWFVFSSPMCLIYKTVSFQSSQTFILFNVFWKNIICSQRIFFTCSFQTCGWKLFKGLIERTCFSSCSLNILLNYCCNGKYVITIVGLYIFSCFFPTDTESHSHIFCVGINNSSISVHWEKHHW